MFRSKEKAHKRLVMIPRHHRCKSARLLQKSLLREKPCGDSPIEKRWVHPLDGQLVALDKRDSVNDQVGSEFRKLTKFQVWVLGVLQGAASQNYIGLRKLRAETETVAGVFGRPDSSGTGQFNHAPFIGADEMIQPEVVSSKTAAKIEHSTWSNSLKGGESWKINAQQMVGALGVRARVGDGRWICVSKTAEASGFPEGLVVAKKSVLLSTLAKDAKKSHQIPYGVTALDSFERKASARRCTGSESGSERT